MGFLFGVCLFLRIYDYQERNQIRATECLCVVQFVQLVCSKQFETRTSQKNTVDKDFFVVLLPGSFFSQLQTTMTCPFIHSTRCEQGWSIHHSLAPMTHAMTPLWRNSINTHDSQGAGLSSSTRRCGRPASSASIRHHEIVQSLVCFASTSDPITAPSGIPVCILATGFSLAAEIPHDVSRLQMSGTFLLSASRYGGDNCTAAIQRIAFLFFFVPCNDELVNQYIDCKRIKDSI